MTTETPKRRGRPARIDIQASDLATLSRDMEFEAMHAGRPAVSRSYPVDGEDDAATGKDGLPAGVVTAKTQDRIRMWVSTSNGWQMRIVPVTAITQNLQNGWKSYCPDCGTNTHDGGPNDCPARESVMYTVCPVCIIPTQIYDNYQISAVSEIEKFYDDPNFVHIDAFTASTPQKRVEAGLILHMWSRHPQETRSMGIAPLPEPSLTVLESMLQTGPNSSPIMGGNAEL